MNEILRRIIENRFADFKGLTISAKVPVTDALINQFIEEFLKTAAAAKTPTPANTAGVQVADVAPLIRKAAITSEAGRIVLDLEIEV